MDRAEGKRERGRTGRPRPRERGKPSGRARGKPGPLLPGANRAQRARANPGGKEHGANPSRPARANPSRGRGRPVRPWRAANLCGSWRPPAARLGPCPCCSSVVQSVIVATMGLPLFLSGAKKGASSFRYRSPPGSCVIEKVYTHTSRALNQTALGLLPSIALSSVG